MKKFLAVILVFLISIISVMFVGCTNQNNLSNIENINNNAVATESDNKKIDENYTMLKNFFEMKSETDNLKATNANLFRFIPYGSVGYTLCGWADKNATHPKDIIIPHTYNNKPVIEIEKAAFLKDGNLQSVKIGSNLKVIGKDAFRDCINLNKIVFGPNINKVGASAFRNCVSLKEVKLPIKMSYIPPKIFMGCSNLEKVIMPMYYYYDVTDSIVYVNVQIIAVQAFQNCVSLKEIELNDNITRIGSGAFRNTGLVDVTLSNNASIGEYTFAYCNELTVNVGKKIKYKDSSFIDCKKVVFA